MIDHYHFTRTCGHGAGLITLMLTSSSLLVSGIGITLYWRKEHILQWKPHLVIADLYGFLNDALPRAAYQLHFCATAG